MSSASVSHPSPAAPQPHGASLPAEVAEERHRLAARVLTDALLLGVVGDALLRATVSGANLMLWTAGMIAAMLTLAKRRHDTVPTDARWLAVPALALSFMYLVRDSEGLVVYNSLALIVTFALLATAIARGPDATLLSSRVRDVIEHVIQVGARTAFGMVPLVLADVSLRQVVQVRGANRVLVILRAVLLAVPLLLVFGGLFAAADPNFERLASTLFNIDTGDVASHILLFGIFSWIAGGFLRATVLSDGTTFFGQRMPDGALGLTEVSIALGSLVALFAAFVGVQMRYFFGGDAVVQSTAGLGYADYARRGFFELVAVATLVLPVLLCANALLRRENEKAETVYRALASTLLVLLAIIMYSAIARMRLYQAAYGMTMDRLFATVFMGWLAIVFVWFAATVLRGRSHRFVAGVLVSGWATLLTLNVANPVGFVAQHNIARAAHGQSLDVRYIQGLGADAAPSLTSYLVSQPLTPPADWTPKTLAESISNPQADEFSARCFAARTLLDRYGPNAQRDWRGWTLGKAAARRAVAQHEQSLKTLAGIDRPKGTWSATCGQRS